MPVKIDLDHLPPLPKRIPEKLKTIREYFRLTPDEIAPKVGARTGAEILAYENDEDDLLVPVLWNYSKLAGCPINHFFNDKREVTFRELEVL
jgi:hypothetical protein